MFATASTWWHCVVILISELMFSSELYVVGVPLIIWNLLLWTAETCNPGMLLLNCFGLSPFWIHVPSFYPLESTNVTGISQNRCQPGWHVQYVSNVEALPDCTLSLVLNISLFLDQVSPFRSISACTNIDAFRNFYSLRSKIIVMVLVQMSIRFLMNQIPEFKIANTGFFFQTQKLTVYIDHVNQYRK